MKSSDLISISSWPYNFQIEQRKCQICLLNALVPSHLCLPDSMKLSTAERSMWEARPRASKQTQNSSQRQHKERGEEHSGEEKEEEKEKEEEAVDISLSCTTRTLTITTVRCKSEA